MGHKSIPGGGPAFPRSGFSGPEGFGRPENGMTLRDYFAAKAMQAHITASVHALANMYKDNPSRVNEIIAMAAYETADAMLAAR